MFTGPAIGRELLLFLKSVNKSKEYKEAESFTFVQQMMQCQQDPEWHAEGDVWTHTKMVCNELTNLPEYIELKEEQQFILFCAAFLHDIAKPLCTTIEDGRIISPKHAVKGAMIARQLLWDLDFNIREKICSLIQYHSLPLWANEKENPLWHIYRSGIEVSNELLYILCKADILGRSSNDFDDLLFRNDCFKLLCEENEVWGNAPVFHNSRSQFTFFHKQLNYPAEIYDDTEFEINILCGLPGTGKDHIAKELGLPMISLDDIRIELGVKKFNGGIQGKIASIAYERAKEYARKKQSFTWNSTNLTQQLRNRIINTLSVYGPRFNIIYTEASMQKIKERRRTEIPHEVLERMQTQLELPKVWEADSLRVVNSDAY